MSAIRRRPRTWRWLVVLDDLPPCPPYSEVICGFLTRRSAEHEARMVRLAHAGRALTCGVNVRVARSQNGSNGTTQ